MIDFTIDTTWYIIAVTNNTNVSTDIIANVSASASTNTSIGIRLKIFFMIRVEFLLLTSMSSLIFCYYCYLLKNFIM